MINKVLQFSLALCLACAALLSSPVGNAQGFEVEPWPARQPVPMLDVIDLQGKRWRLADLRGKAVLINFWASWCPPCRAEMPSLQSLSELYGPDKLVVLMVNFKESATVAQRFAQRSGLSLPVVLDPQGQMARQWGATAFPTTVLVAADGGVRGVVRGEVDWAGMAAARLVEPLLAPVGVPR